MEGPIKDHKNATFETIWAAIYMLGLKISSITFLSFIYYVSLILLIKIKISLRSL